MGRNFSIKILIEAIDKATAPLGRVSSKLEAMSRPIAKLGKGVFNLGQNLVRTTRRFVTWSSIAGVAMVAFLKKTTDVGADLFKMSQQLGMTAEKLQEYHFAALMANASTDAFNMGFAYFARQTVQAAAGMGESRDIFKAFDIDLEDGQKNLKDSSVLFGEMADAISRLKSSDLQLEVASRLFGMRSGKDMVAMMKEGSGWLAEMGQQARETGAIISEDGVNSMADYEDKSKRLWQVIKGQLLSAIADMIPKVTALAGKMTKWLVANKGIVRSKIIEYAKGLYRNLAVLARVASVVLKIFNALGGLRFAGLYGLYALASVAGGKFALFAAAVWGLTEALKALDKHVAKGGIQKFFDAMVDMEYKIGMITIQISKDFYDLGVDAVENLIIGMGEAWSRLTLWLSDQINSLADIMPAWAKKLFGITTPISLQQSLAGNANINPATKGSDFDGRLKIEILSPNGNKVNIASMDQRGNANMDFSAGIMSSGVSGAW